MDLNNIGEAEDRITKLPDALIHHILSFLGIKSVARTSILSKRWNYIWTSIPILDFSCFISSSEINKFMEFVDRTLLLHDTSSNIQRFHLKTDDNMSASRVHSWIENLTKRNIQELHLWLDQEKPFFLPICLFKCQSLVTLELTVNLDVTTTTNLPKKISFPKLKSLTLCGIQFSDDYSWNEQHFSNCPVLENLFLHYCTWFGVRNFCISVPTLKRLEIDYDGITDEDGLPDCALKIHAPNLVSFTYRGSVAKEYVLSSFQMLESARVFLYTYDDVPMNEQNNKGAAVRKFVRALTHVQSLTIESLEVLSVVDDFVNILPTFHILDKLFLELDVNTDKSVFLVLKAAPNLTRLVFNDVRTFDVTARYRVLGFANHIYSILKLTFLLVLSVSLFFIPTQCIYEDEEEDSWAGHMLTVGCLFQHLQSVCFICFNGEPREMRWLKLILKTAKALLEVTFGSHANCISATTKEVLMSEFPSLPKASDGCMLKFH